MPENIYASDYGVSCAYAYDQDNADYERTVAEAYHEWYEINN